MPNLADDVPEPTSAPLVEFLNTLPSPLTTTLVGLAPAIATTRRVLQILTWKAHWEECWLALAAWWAVCLVPEIGLRYVLHVLEQPALVSAGLSAYKQKRWEKAA